MPPVLYCYFRFVYVTINIVSTYMYHVKSAIQYSTGTAYTFCSSSDIILGSINSIPGDIEPINGWISLNVI